MRFNLIYGKCKSGKSSYIYEKIQEYLKQKEEKKLDFDKIYIITPEQFSFSIEKKLLTKIGNAVIDVEVLTFSRMADRYINSSSKIITKSLKSMLIYSILENYKNELKMLNNSYENIEIAINAIDEFKKHGITIEQLRQESQKANELLKVKLLDLILIFEKYEAFIEKAYIDSNDKINILARKLEDATLQKSIIFIDEFNGFTKCEMELIKKLYENSMELNLSTSIDDTNFNTNPDIDIYYDNKENLNTLLGILNTKINKKIPISKEDNKYKTSDDNKEDLIFLKENLFTSGKKLERFNKDVENISVRKHLNEFDEIENIAKDIIKNIRCGYRFKDIAIATDNIDEYKLIVKGIFSKYNIPVFLDDKMQVNQNKIIQFVSCIFDILNSNFNVENIISLLKLSIFDIPTKDIYILEKYATTWNINYLKKWSKPFENKYEEQEIVNKCEALRKKYIEPLIVLNNDIDTKSSTVKVIYKYLEDIGLDEIVAEKYNKYNSQNKFEKAQEYKNSYQHLLDVLDEINIIFPDEKITKETILNLIKVGLSNTNFALLPATNDQVVFGDLRRSKRDNIKILYLINANENVLPKIVKSEGFLNDADRDVLKKDNMQIAKNTISNIYEANFNIYRALITPEDKLNISYITCKKDGQESKRSVFVNKILKMFPRLKIEDSIKNTGDVFANKKVSYENLLEYISDFSAKLEKEKALENLNKIDKNIQNIYSYFKKDEEFDTNFDAIFFENYAFNLTKETVDNLYREKLITSISQLEKYAKCPFSFHIRYNLKIQDSQRQEVDLRDMGTLIHDIIEHFFIKVSQNAKNEKIDGEAFKNEKQYLINLDEVEQKQIIDNLIFERLKKDQYFKFNLKNHNILIRRLKHVLYNAIEYIKKGIIDSDFYIYKQEATFGKDKEFKPITINVDGRKVNLIGKIDRVDKDTKGKNYVRIVDYKSSAKKIDLNEVYKGCALQLFTYLDAILKEENSKVAGLLYYNFNETLANKKESKQEILDKSYKMSGYVLSDTDVIKMQDNKIEEGKPSKLIPVTVNKDGTIKQKGSSVLSEDEFDVIRKYIPNIIEKLAKQMLDGNIEIKPIMKNKEKECKYCKYNSICNFDTKFKGNKLNKIRKNSDNNVINLMKKDLE